MKILAIDDQQLVLMPLAKRLKDIGYNVFTSSNPEEALLLYATFKPDLLIVDINMPKTSGIEVIKQIKSNYNEPKPIMVLSGNTDKNLIVQAFELGVRDFMKTIEPGRGICESEKFDWPSRAAPKISGRTGSYPATSLRRCGDSVL